MTNDCLSRAPWPYPPSLLSLRHLVQQYLYRYPSGHDCLRSTVQRGWGSRGMAHTGNSCRVALVLASPLPFLLASTWSSITFIAACGARIVRDSRFSEDKEAGGRCAQESGPLAPVMQSWPSPLTQHSRLLTNDSGANRNVWSTGQIQPTLSETTAPFQLLRRLTGWATKLRFWRAMFNLGSTLQLEQQLSVRWKRRRVSRREFGRRGCQNKCRTCVVRGNALARPGASYLLLRNPISRLTGTGAGEKRMDHTRPGKRVPTTRREIQHACVGWTMPVVCGHGTKLGHHSPVRVLVLAVLCKADKDTR
jgi:hypothetical protein